MFSMKRRFLYMEETGVYLDVEKRTGGDIYIGVVGPVRTGKSTFIKKFMQALVLPNAEGDAKARMNDELPQSAEGKTVMTTEPKFVPSQAAEISLGGGGASAKARVRLIDCVGYSVEGAFGFEENGSPRLINTPWSASPMPFEKAAELGTEKVIKEHSTIGVLITSDGSFTDIPRENYVRAEERTVRELKEIGKPFIILLNTVNGSSAETQKLVAEMEEKYHNTVLAVNCSLMTEEDLRYVLSEVLFEFPVTNVDFNIPDWMQVLPEQSKIISDVAEKIRKTAPSVKKMKDCSLFEKCFAKSDYVSPPVSCNMNLGDGSAVIELAAKEGVFYRILGEECGEDLSDDCKLMNYVKTLAEAKRSYDRIKQAFEEAEINGYGMVAPASDDMTLEKPEMIRQGAGYGVSLKASAPGYHIMKIDVTSEFSPMMGTRERSEEFVRNMLSRFDSEPEKIWDTDMFGKSLRELVNEGLSSKMASMPDNVRKKMRRTVTRIVNEGRGGVICIIL